MFEVDKPRVITRCEPKGTKHLEYTELPPSSASRATKAGQEAASRAGGRKEE